MRSLRGGPVRREVALCGSGPAWESDLLDGTPVASVTVSGVHRHILTFYIEDQAWFRWNDETRDLHVQLKAKGLWAYGYDKVMPY